MSNHRLIQTTERISEKNSGLSAAGTLLYVFGLMIRRKRFIALGTALAVCAALIIVCRLKPSYTAEATILPPQHEQSSLSMLASEALGGLAGQSLGMKTAVDVYMGMLKSRTVLDAIIARFNLQDVYHRPFASDARLALKNNVTFGSSKDSFISIEVKDTDPHRAADIANAFVEELNKENSRLAVSEASQRRLFFEQQVDQAKSSLADAESALKATQQSTGLVVPAGQAEALVRSGAELRAQIASKQVELQAMQAFATEQNPQVIILKREIAALEGQLHGIETRESNNVEDKISGATLPEAGLQYVRKLRDVKYHEALYEALAKQYEASRIDEAKQAPIIQQVDRAIAPEKPVTPPRVTLVVVSAFLGFVLSTTFVLVFERSRDILSVLRDANNSMGSTQLAA